MTYDDWKRTDPLDLGCEHSRCDHRVCVWCEPGCEACAQEADEGAADTDLIVERERRAWKLQQQMEGETWRR